MLGLAVSRRNWRPSLSLSSYSPFHFLHFRTHSTTNHHTAVNHSDEVPEGRKKLTTWPAQLVRTTFYDYFEKRGHRYHPPSPVIPHNDRTLLFTNAGMNQFKPIFLGTVDPNTNLQGLKKVYNAQGCIRAGGKHNDLEDVGNDVYHHTYFEMLGNWSFGDYFKREAITYAWELLSQVYQLPPDRLYVSYHGGDEKIGLAPDYETRDLWLALGLDPSRVLPFGNKENFWEMGEQGPCGPSSEIHYDRVGGRDAAHLVNADDPSVIELWNLVFIQYNRGTSGALRLLPQRHVDTGLGLERLVSVLQNTTSNYDTDLFAPLFTRIQEVTGVRPYTGHVGQADQDGVDRAYRVVADHARSLTFSILDGGIPSNEGRGYVIRRILRRGCRYASHHLGVKLGHFFSGLVDPVLATMKGVYLENHHDVNKLKQILDEEEISFSRTLHRGEQLFEICLNQAKKTGTTTISGLDAWKLYDTYGFPLDLTKLMAAEHGMAVNQTEFDQAQTQAKLLSRSNRNLDEGSSTLSLNLDDIALLDKDPTIPQTNDDPKYHTPSLTTTICGLFYDGELHETLNGSTERDLSQLKFGILLNENNFYAESGGQRSDSGTLVGDTGVQFTVERVESFGGYILHIGQLMEGTLQVGESVTAQYDPNIRASLSRNHTTTHLLNLALRKVLQSDTVDQRGSQIGPDRFRFDFNHNKPLSPAQLLAIEEFCRDRIQIPLPVSSQSVSLDHAKKIHGLRAVFGEVYPDPVRVVTVGPTVSEVLADPTNSKWQDVSIELCGGTHLNSTSQVSQFTIVEEAAVAKGIRRLVAITGPDADLAIKNAQDFESRLETLSTLEKVALDDQLKLLTRELESLVLPLVARTTFRTQLLATKKKRDTAIKQFRQRQVAEVVEVVNQLITESEDGIVVALLPPNYDAKVLAPFSYETQSPI